MPQAEKARGGRRRAQRGTLPPKEARGHDRRPRDTDSGLGGHPASQSTHSGVTSAGGKEPSLAGDPARETSETVNRHRRALSTGTRVACPPCSQASVALTTTADIAPSRAAATGDLKAPPEREPRAIANCRFPDELYPLPSSAAAGQALRAGAVLRAPTCFGGHSGHALLFLPETDVIFNGQTSD